MEFANLDMITRRWLLERGLPIHYYIDGLTHAASCLREISLRGLCVINSKSLPVDDNGYVDLPHDFQDDVGVYLPFGQRLIGLPEQKNITPLRLRDTTGAFTPYSSVTSNSADSLSAPVLFNYYWNVNDNGEPTGRFFGSGGGTNSGYKVFKERRQIQMTENFAGGGIVLLYISNGQSSDAATQVDWYAFSAIQAYIDWQTSPYAIDKDSAPARKFYNELTGLGYGTYGMGVEDIKNIVRSAYSGFIKN